MDISGLSTVSDFVLTPSAACCVWCFLRISTRLSKSNLLCQGLLSPKPKGFAISSTQGLGSRKLVAFSMWRRSSAINSSESSSLGSSSAWLTLGLAKYLQSASEE
jgi:hypothetical protein